MRGKNLFFRLIFAGFVLNFAISSAQNIEPSSLKTIIENLIKINEKMDSMSKRMEQLEANSSNNCNACEPNLCIYGGSCVSILCGKDFMCDKCPRFRSGLRCENFDCRHENLCWMHRNTMYVVLEPKSNWTEAERKCQSEGMGLIMPKEKDQTAFIVNKLKAIYGSKDMYFWMGLKREGGSAWTWTDGSELGSYTGGRSDFKIASDNRYGHLYLHGNDHDMWNYYGPTNFNVYPLCEKRVYDH